MKLLGNALIALGLIDFALWQFADIDIYSKIGIDIKNDALFFLTPIIAGGLGTLIRSLAR